jgi:hypothetical protein
VKYSAIYAVSDIQDGIGSGIDDGIAMRPAVD